MEEEKKEALQDIILERIGASRDEVEKVEITIVWKRKNEKPEQS